MRIAFCLMVLSALLWLPVSVLAATDLEKFQNTVGKSAPSGGDVTPPVVCVCKDGGSLQNFAGQLIQFTQGFHEEGQGVTVYCAIPFFKKGTVSASAECDSWELLPKP